MTETAKERIYRGALETMSDSDFMGNKYVKKFVKGVFKQIEDVPVTTDKLSVEKLQEQLNTAKKALSEIRENIEEHNQIYDLSVDTALLLEGIDGIAFDALAAIGRDDDENRF